MSDYNRKKAIHKVLKMLQERHSCPHQEAHHKMDEMFGPVWRSEMQSDIQDKDPDKHIHADILITDPDKVKEFYDSLSRYIQSNTPFSNDLAEYDPSEGTVAEKMFTVGGPITEPGGKPETRSHDTRLSGALKKLAHKMEKMGL